MKKNPDKKLPRSWFVLSLVLGLGALLSLVFHLPTVHQIEAWHWPLHERPLQWSIALPFLLAMFGWIAWLHRSNYRGTIPLLFVAAMAMQWGPALSIGEGVHALRKHAQFSGHGEFARTGSVGLDKEKVFRDYEKFIQMPSQRFSPSKPPGQLLAYITIGEMAEAVWPLPKANISRARDAKHGRMLNFLVFLLPILAASAVVPLLAIAQRMVPERPAVPVALFIASPCFALVQMHFDQAVYPMLALWIWFLGLRAYESGRPWFWGAILGVGIYLACFVSFSLLPALVILPFLVFSVHKPRLPNGFLLGTVLGFALTATVFYLQWGYDPVLRYKKAMVYHQEWKQWQGTLSVYWISIRVNLIETIWWLGPSLFLPLLWSVKESRQNERKYLAIGGFLVLLLLLGFSKTIGEVARLWLFLLPLPLLLLSKDLKQHQAAILIGMSVLWTMAFKYMQDFW
ncbi:MAG: hypothetical protein VX278_00005 [Myxococcota bacterium]|nr:hypothetical protein [Myxococcota bacterium]